MVDLPGYGYATMSKAEMSPCGAMIADYLRGRVTLRAVVLLADVRRGLEEDDLELLDFLEQTRGPGAVTGSLPEVARFVAATKLDKVPLSKRKPALAAFKKDTGVAAVGFSAVTGDGREELWKRIRAVVT
jgi:GTP-binding protein